MAERPTTQARNARTDPAARRHRKSADSRTRLLASAKRLMAAEGYERVSTAAIARAAGTSESQLVRYFGSKAGLLDAAFNEGWAMLNPRVARVVAQESTAREATIGILSGMMRVFERDPDLARLMLFEGRRVRGDTGEILLSKGFQDFAARLKRIIERGQEEGSFSKKLKPIAVVSALLGAAEGMIRDRLLTKRPAYTGADVRAAFGAMISGLAPEPVGRKPR
jgi:AcrR family transcriptional regulator